jgi:TonB family protein
VAPRPAEPAAPAAPTGARHASAPPLPALASLGAAVPASGEAGSSTSAGGEGELEVGIRGGGTLLEYWTAQVWAKIESEWVAPRIGLPRTESLAVTVSFTVTRDGRIRSVRVMEPSGNRYLDRSAERALADAAPLPPLPPFFRQESVEVTVTFRATGGTG